MDGQQAWRPAEIQGVERQDATPRDPITPSNSELSAAGDDIVSTLRLCLLKEDGPPQTDKADCLAGLDYSALSRTDIGALLADHGLSAYGRALLLKGYLLQFNPGTALSELNALSALTGDDYRSFEMFAAAVHYLGEEDAGWVEAFAAFLTGPDLFAPEGTRNELQIAGQLIEIRPDLRAILEAGARGEWGGSAGQIDQAYWVVIRDMRAGETGPFLELVDSVLDSAFLTKDNGWRVAQSTLGHLVIHGREHPEVQDEMVSRVWRLLDDPDFALATALQIHHQGLGFGGEELLGEEDTRRIRQRARDIVAARFGQSYLDQ